MTFLGYKKISYINYPIEFCISKLQNGEIVKKCLSQIKHGFVLIYVLQNSFMVVVQIWISWNWLKIRCCSNKHEYWVRTYTLKSACKIELFLDSRETCIHLIFHENIYLRHLHNLILFTNKIVSFDEEICSKNTKIRQQHRNIWLGFSR